jgi:VanZ family protein
MRHVLNFLRSRLGNNGLEMLIWIIFGIAALALIRLVWQKLIKGKHVLRFLVLALVLAGAVYHASSMHIIEERIHLVQFGLLGYLLSKDNYSKDLVGTILVAVAVCLFVAGLDEVFQYYLPTRVGDIRDIIFGTVGGMWGAAVFAVLNHKV